MLGQGQLGQLGQQSKTRTAREEIAKAGQEREDRMARTWHKDRTVWT
jgi:hypothetical protein